MNEMHGGVLGHHSGYPEEEYEVIVYLEYMSLECFDGSLVLRELEWYRSAIFEAV